MREGDQLVWMGGFVGVINVCTVLLWGILSIILDIYSTLCLCLGGKISHLIPRINHHLSASLKYCTLCAAYSISVVSHNSQTYK